MPKTKKAKVAAVAKSSKKPAKKLVKKAAKAPVRKVVKAAKSVTKKAAAKKTTPKSAVKKTAVKTSKPVAKKTTTAKSKQVAKSTTTVKSKTVKTPAVKPVKVLKTPMNKPAKATNAVSTQSTLSPTATSHRPAASGGPRGFAPYREVRDEEYMNEKQLSHFQHVLHLWKEQIHADRNIVAKQIRDDSVNFPDPLDRAVVEEEHTLEWRAREREHRVIEKIDQALSSIKQGDYGFCEACGAEIGIRRLEARPTATLCIDCKTIDEIREKLSGVTE